MLCPATYYEQYSPIRPQLHQILACDIHMCGQSPLSTLSGQINHSSITTSSTVIAQDTTNDDTLRVVLLSLLPLSSVPRSSDLTTELRYFSSSFPITANTQVCPLLAAAANAFLQHPSRRCRPLHCPPHLLPSQTRLVDAVGYRLHSRLGRHRRLLHHSTIQQFPVHFRDANQRWRQRKRVLFLRVV